MNTTKNSTETKAVKTKATTTKTGTETPEAVSLDSTTPEISTETKATKATTPESTQPPTEATKTGTTQTAEDATSTPGTQTPEKTRKTTEATPDTTSALGENSTGDAKTTEDVIYHVLGVNGKDKAYLVHIDPDVFAGTDWTYQRIEIAVTGTNHVTEVAPEHYDGEITDEVVVSLNADGQLCIAGIPVTPGTPTDSSAQTDEDMTGALAPDYLSGGYYKGEGKARYIDPALVGDTAQRLAQDLAAGKLTPGGFNPILRELKRADKKTLPLDAKQGALAGAIVAAKRLEQRHRAPHLLVDVLERNRAAVQTDADYKAAVKHLTAVGVLLGDYQ